MCPETRGSRRRRPALLAAIMLACLIPAGAAQTPSGWIEARSEHFVVYTDAGEQKARRLLDDLEARRQVFSATVRALTPRSAPTEVLLFDRVEEFQRFVPEALRELGKGAYLFQGAAGDFLLAADRSVDDIISDVGHSLGHLLVAHAVMWRPFWLEEGAGEYVRNLGRNPGWNALSAQDGYPVRDLLEIVPSQAFDDLGNGGDFRRQSYQLFRLLLSGHREALDAHLRALGQEDGIDAVLEGDFEALQAELLSYRDSPLPFEAVPAAAVIRSLTAAEIDAVQGDLALSAGLDSLARSLYLNSPTERGRLGILVQRRSQGETAAVRAALEQVVDAYPASAPARYHLGALRPETAAERARQIEVLEEAAALAPRMGRVYAELAWLHALDGRPAEALPLVERALALEPEYADRFYEILARTQLLLGDYAAAAGSIQIAAALPHRPEAGERYDRLVVEFYREIESARRAAEAVRVEALRREVEALADAVDPRPLPAPEESAPIGRVSYAITSGPERDVTPPRLLEAPLPDYSAELRRAGVQGQVVLDVDVDRRGEVSQVRVRSSAHPDLAPAAFAAIRQWRFDPARRNEESTAYSFRLTIRFFLE